MTTRFYTYVYFDINDTPIYVGKGCGLRYLSHFLKSRKTKLANYLKKRKSEGITLTPQIEFHLNEKTAFAIERFWIGVYGKLRDKSGTLYNLTDGGEGVSGPKGPMSQAHKDKIGAAHKNKVVSEETKAKQSLVKLGVKNPMYGTTHVSGRHCLGRKHSEEAKANMRKAKANITEETRQKHREAALRRPPMSEETREKLSAIGKSRSGPGNRKGIKHSDETKAKMRDAQKKRLNLKKQLKDVL